MPWQSSCVKYWTNEHACYGERKLLLNISRTGHITGEHLLPRIIIDCVLVEHGMSKTRNLVIINACFFCKRLLFLELFHEFADNRIKIRSL